MDKKEIISLLNEISDFILELDEALSGYYATEEEIDEMHKEQQAKGAKCQMAIGLMLKEIRKD